jgi:hypothetical protein
MCCRQLSCTGSLRGKREIASACFYKYLENAEDATLKGSAPTRLFTIEEVRSGWWKQGTITVQTTTMLPPGGPHWQTGTTSASGSQTSNSQGT